MKNNKPLIIANIIAIIILIIETTYLLTNYFEKEENPENKTQILNNYFEDKKFANCVLAHYNNSNSSNYTSVNELTDDQLATITKLTCFGSINLSSEEDSGISDVIDDYKGIEKLTGLEELLAFSSAKANNLDLSHNTKLVNLYLMNIDENSKLKVTGLDSLSNLTTFSATNIDIENNNLSNLSKLESLNFSNVKSTFDGTFRNENLKTISIESSDITNIDVSNLNLTSLNLTIPTLNSLTLGNQPNLTEIVIEDGTLIDVDFSGCPNLEEVTISESMSCVNIDYEAQVSRSYLTSTGYYHMASGFAGGTIGDVPINTINLICKE